MPAEGSVDFMREVFVPADLELFAEASFAVFGVRPGAAGADRALLGMPDIGEVIGEVGHGGGGPQRVQPLSPRLLLWWQLPSGSSNRAREWCLSRSMGAVL